MVTTTTTRLQRRQRFTTIYDDSDDSDDNDDDNDDNDDGEFTSSTRAFPLAAPIMPVSLAVAAGRDRAAQAPALATPATPPAEAAAMFVAGGG